MSDIQWVVFDLGGVLVRLGGVREFGDLIGESDDSRVWSRWLGCPWVRDFERGRCTSDEFAEGMVGTYEIELTPLEFLERFRSWPQGLYPGACELVESLVGRTSVACLSNTNQIHWETQLDADRLMRFFDRKFLSHELDLIKPDKEIYQHVVRDLDCPANSVCFLDDNQINVDAAIEFGLDAHRVEGPEQARELLRDRGLVG